MAAAAQDRIPVAAITVTATIPARSHPAGPRWLAAACRPMRSVTIGTYFIRR
jgi:hypothetical protein